MPKPTAKVTFVLRTFKRSSSLGGTAWSLAGQGSTENCPPGCTVYIYNTFGVGPPESKAGQLEDGPVESNGLFAFSFDGLLSSWKQGPIWAVIKDADGNEVCRSRRVEVPRTVGIGGEDDEEPGEDDSCFFSVAAGPTPEALYVNSLRSQLRKKTRWGKAFEEDLAEVFGRFNPAIIEAMRTDARAAQLIHWGLVMPLLSYVRFATSRPRDWSLREDNVELAAFLDDLKGNLASWTGAVQVSEDFAELDNRQIVDELNATLDYARQEDATHYLDRLTESGALPITGDERELDELNKKLSSAGRSERQVARILGERRR